MGLGQLRWHFSRGTSWLTPGHACKVVRGGLWAVIVGSLAGLALIHLRLEPYVDSTMDHREFYNWHRAYLIAAAVQWVTGLAYVVVMLRSWTAKPQAA